jgi:Zn ribbon nucleic-acid-binding protein
MSTNAHTTVQYVAVNLTEAYADSKCPACRKSDLFLTTFVAEDARGQIETATCLCGHHSVWINGRRAQ